MTNLQKIQCNAIIHAASASCAAIGAGLAQLPTSDNLVIAPIQGAMAIGLAKVFGLRLEDGAAKAAVSSAAATMVGRAVSQVAVGWIPGAGNIVNAVTAASITEGIGWIMANEFEKQAALTLI